MKFLYTQLKVLNTQMILTLNHLSPGIVMLFPTNTTPSQVFEVVVNQKYKSMLANVLFYLTTNTKTEKLKHINPLT